MKYRLYDVYNTEGLTRGCRVVSVDYCYGVLTGGIRFSQPTEVEGILVQVEWDDDSPKSFYPLHWLSKSDIPRKKPKLRKP